jgi:cell filamentation protein
LLREVCSACRSTSSRRRTRFSAGAIHPFRDLERDAFIDRLAYYFGEVNAIHPFREGNGRAQRAFFEQLARDAGFALAWQHLDGARNIATSVAIMRGDPIPMRSMLDELIQER